MVISDHTTKAFDIDLQELTRLVAEMGGLAEELVADAVDALAERDADRAQRTVAADPEIDALQAEIEEKAVLTIARRQPMAVDLREIVGALRVSNDLERIGDLAKNIGKRVMALDGEFHPPKLIRGVEHMGSLVLAQLKEVLDSYARHDLKKALAVWNGDEEVDAMCTSLFRELLTYMMEDPRNITFCIHLMFCAKNIERMGDHATNIAETVWVPELSARVRALLRRALPERLADVLSFGDLEVDREKKRVSRAGRAIDLGPTEYRLLEFLMERPGRVFSREQLLNGVWGSQIYIDERTVDVHVGRLRKALNRGHNTDPIRTVRGAGYALDDRFGKTG